MSKYCIKIELLSDLCVSDGGVYNSYLDIDICYDCYGFPYIPAKRIKGCLRECAMELNDWGCAIDIKKIFGDKGDCDNSGNLKLENAVLSDYEALTREVSAAGGHALYHPQNVLNSYSYVRTQTSIDNETGVALDSSLRTMRVVKKGLVFVTKVTLDDKYADQLKRCVNGFTNIGMHRTRGLGEIRAELVKCDVQPEEKNTVAVPEHANYLSYRIRLVEPMISLSVAGGQEKAKDYIEGSTMMGLLLRRASAEDRELLLNDRNLIFSNAYLSVENQRTQELPAYLSTIKNNSTTFINNLYHSQGVTSGVQIQSIKHGYAIVSENEIKKGSVVVEERYHHRRPEDKSRGRAMSVAGGDSAFYQIASIEEGQDFRGYIRGSREQLQCVVRLLSDRECRIGYGRSAEYGRAQITIEEVKCVPEAAQKKEAERVLVTLLAPTLLYSEKAMYSTSVEDLLGEICAVLKLTMDDIDMEATRKYINYTNLGGFNSTWRMRKPSVAAFDKGSALDIHLKGVKNIEIPELVSLGERTGEGYGECTIAVIAAQGAEMGSFVSEAETAARKQICVETGSLGERIASSLFRGFIRQMVLRSETFKEQKGDADERATVSNMLLMCSENKCIEDVERSVNARYEKNSEEKKGKLTRAIKILDNVKRDSAKAVEQFSEKYGLEGFERSLEEVQMEYLNTYLQELKYKIRMKKGETIDESAKDNEKGLL